MANKKRSGLKLALKIYNEMKDEELMKHTNMAMKASEIMNLLYVTNLFALLHHIDQNLSFRSQAYFFKLMKSEKECSLYPITSKTKINSRDPKSDY